MDDKVRNTKTTSKPENAKSRYVLVAGQKVYLNREQQQAWDQMITRERHRAWKEGTCRQSNYHHCFGDCAVCPYHIQGQNLSYDDAIATKQDNISPEDRAPEDIIIEKETCRQIYAKAAELYKNGDRILYLKAVEGRSTYEIAKELDMPHTTVNKYFNRLLQYLREHRDEFI